MSPLAVPISADFPTPLGCLLVFPSALLHLLPVGQASVSAAGDGESPFPVLPLLASVPLSPLYFPSSLPRLVVLDTDTCG